MKIPMGKVLLIIVIQQVFFAGGANGQVAVIAHKGVSTDAIGKQQLLDFYTGDDRRWDDGVPVTVLDLKEKNEAKKALYQYLGKSTSRMKSIWIKRMLAGEGDPPEAMESEDEMLQKVASTPGAVGFVSESKVTNEVKILAIIARE
jgi:ABC-type phosphate transport system substrate-binding protein